MNCNTENYTYNIKLNKVKKIAKKLGYRWPQSQANIDMLLVCMIINLWRSNKRLRKKLK